MWMASGKEGISMGKGGDREMNTKCKNKQAYFFGPPCIRVANSQISLTQR